MLNFVHYGKCGDIIYSLYVVKQLGGGNYHIVINDKLRKDSFLRLKPLLESQPYINNVEVININEIPENYINLNKFREFPRKTIEKQHLIQTHIDSINLNYGYKLNNYDHSIWLYVPKTEWKHDYIVIQRSDRYHNGTFKYMNHIEPNLKIIFCGTLAEYNKFQNEHKNLNIEHIIPKDFLEFAKLIRNSKYYIGNQSVGSAIAQGLSHPQIQETHHKESNCKPDQRLIYGSSKSK